MELSGYDICYVPRTTIISQVLVNFIAEFTVRGDEAQKEVKLYKSKWSIYVDGFSNARGSEA